MLSPVWIRIANKNEFDTTWKRRPVKLQRNEAFSIKRRVCHLSVGIKDRHSRGHCGFSLIARASAKAPLLFGAPRAGQAGSRQIVEPLHIFEGFAFAHHPQVSSSYHRAATDA